MFKVQRKRSLLSLWSKRTYQKKLSGSITGEWYGTKIFPQQSADSTRQNQTQRDESVNRTGANNVAQSNIASGSGTKSKGQVGRSKTQGKVFAMT